MRIPRILRRQFGSIFKRSEEESNLSAELAEHLAQETQHHLARGLDPEAAHLAALRAMGGVEQAKERCRDARATVWFERLYRDVLYGLRTLRKDPWFSLMAVLSLALGIGANTAIYSVMDAMMLRALPVHNPAELVIFNWQAKTVNDPPVIHSHSGTKYDDSARGAISPDFPYPAYELFRQHNSAFSTLLAFKRTGPLNVVARGQAQVVQAEFVSGNFFSGLGVAPAAGRLLSDKESSPAVAVLSYAYWQEHFAADPNAMGQSITINRIPFTIIGVTTPEFFGVNPGSAPVLYLRSRIGLRWAAIMAMSSKRFSLIQTTIGWTSSGGCARA